VQFESAQEYFQKYTENLHHYARKGLGT